MSLILKSHSKKPVKKMLKEFKVFSNLFFSSHFGPGGLFRPFPPKPSFCHTLPFLFLCNAISHPPPLSSSSSSFHNSNSSREGEGGRRTVPADPDRGGEDVESTREKKIELEGEGPHTYVLGLSPREREKRGGCRRRENNLAGTNGRRGGGAGGTKMRLPSLPTDPFPFPRWRCSQPGTSQAGFFFCKRGHSILATSEMAISTPPLHTSAKKRPTPTCWPTQTEIRQRTRRYLKKAFSVRQGYCTKWTAGGKVKVPSWLLLT